MMLAYLILILIAGGIAAWIAGKWNHYAARVISLASVIIDLIIVLGISFQPSASGQNEWIAEFKASWIPQSGIGIHLALDGLSLLMLILTFFIGILAILVSWKEIRQDTGFFHFNLLLTLAGITGVFLSLDLFLFYFFWELMLIPMYLLILIWGNGNRVHASFKFFIFTQVGGLLMFLAIIGLYIVHGHNTGTYTFEYHELIGTAMSPSLQFLLMSGFLIGFLVKLPAVPLHNWLPDAYAEAPVAGTLILASLMAKTAAYGLIRFVIPLFPEASALFAPFGMAIGSVGILYGAMIAFSQTDLKRLIAYSSISHMGFVILGVFAFNEIAYQGVVLQMIVHGISTGALFIIAGQLHERLHTRNINEMGGLWEKIPVMGGICMIFSMASLGLPGLGNFIAEFLILTGTFKASILFSSIASLGLIFATLYALRIIHKIFFGKTVKAESIKDLSIRESIILGLLVAAIVISGLFPQPLLNTAKPAILKNINMQQNSVIEGMSGIDYHPEVSSFNEKK